MRPNIYDLLLGNPSPLSHLIKENKTNHHRNLAPIRCLKLSCLPCWYFFQATWEILNHKFHVPGTHGKVYHPWKFPDTALQTICAEEQAWEVPKHICNLNQLPLRGPSTRTACGYVLLTSTNARSDSSADSGEMGHSEDYYIAQLEERGVLQKSSIA